MIALFVALVVAVLVAGFLVWLLGFLPISEPYGRLARGLIIVCVVVFVIVRLWGARGLLPG